MFVFFALGDSLWQRQSSVITRGPLAGTPNRIDEAALRSSRQVLYIFLFMGVTIWVGTVLSVAQLGAAQSSAGDGLDSTLSSPLSSAAPVSPAVRAVYCAAAWGSASRRPEQRVTGAGAFGRL